MSKKTHFMIVAGASVVVVRDGKRITIAPGGGAKFDEDEIAAINRAVPGSLRKPINESQPADSADESEDAPKKAAPKAKAKAAAKSDADDDADEDI